MKTEDKKVLKRLFIEKPISFGTFLIWVVLMVAVSDKSVALTSGERLIAVLVCYLGTLYSLDRWVLE